MTVQKNRHIVPVILPLNLEFIAGFITVALAALRCRFNKIVNFVCFNSGYFIKVIVNDVFILVIPYNKKTRLNRYGSEGLNL